MAEDSIYGPCRDTLPRIMDRLTGMISGWNMQEKKSTGHELYEHLSARVKTEESMREKCGRKGYPETPETALSVFHDAVGLRIITRFVDDVYRIAEKLENLEGCTVLEKKDYIKNAKENGYRSYHMILDYEVPWTDIHGRTPGHFPVEFQLRTIAMDSWASLEHEMKYKKSVASQKLITAELKRCADELASCDLSMQTIRDLIRNDGGKT